MWLHKNEWAVVNVRYNFDKMIDTVDFNTWLVLAVLASPHVLYAHVWFFPHRWTSIFKKNTVEVFENIAWMLKCASSWPLC
jgi:hypothetical protein